LVKVKKRSENFDRAKLKVSLRKAGAKEEHATRVAETVERRVWEGIMTTEIKELAATELRRMDPKTATVYETYKKPNEIVVKNRGID